MHFLWQMELDSTDIGSNFDLLRCYGTGTARRDRRDDKGKGGASIPSRLPVKRIADPSTSVPRHAGTGGMTKGEDGAPIRVSCRLREPQGMERVVS
jgi:hypothetical protein